MYIIFLWQDKSVKKNRFEQTYSGLFVKAMSTYLFKRNDEHKDKLKIEN